ncbi:PIR protein, putative [Plasmodium sp. gorilla clade G1]|nr:PIR protein, putative [Plasmodium sp. gorilla clade G1]
MKVHYINILLFALPLNILLLSSEVYNQRNHKSTTSRHTKTNRSLCECEVYAAANYESDPEMKKVMGNFSRQTSQRFHEYDERMKITRQKCKDKCDKEIQKIILKDKLEKQMALQLATLDTKITTDDIPTCICEKSLADKTEKFCFNCGANVGGGVTLSSAVLGGIGEAALSAWKPTALKAAIAAALEANNANILAAANAAGLKAGKEAVIGGLKNLFIDKLFHEIYNSFVTTSRYTDLTKFSDLILNQYRDTCTLLFGDIPPECDAFKIKTGIHLPNGNTYGTDATIAIPEKLNGILGEAKKAADAVAKTASESATNAIKAQETRLLEAGFNNSITSIYASIIAILIIVLIMVIIYLILRYKRKKKMKKKLQYIKLLEE